MANNCFYTMRVKGKKENVMEFHKRMEDYDAPNHLFRMFSADITDEWENNDDTVTIEVLGDCAWSIESCCRASGYSGGTDLFAVNSKELGLVIECYSDECGIGFQEHYLYDHGECLADECVDWCEYYYEEDKYESFEEFKKEYNLPEDATEDDLNDNGCYEVGGFPYYCEFSI